MERRERIDHELAQLRERSNAMKAKWQAEKDQIGKIRELKARIDQFKVEAERAQRSADLTRAAELQYGEIPKAERELVAAEEKLAQEQASRHRARGAGGGRVGPEGYAGGTLRVDPDWPRRRHGEVKRSGRGARQLHA